MNKTMRRTLIILTALLLVPLAAQCAASDLTLWYRHSAAKGMNEALPIGTGRFGSLIYAAPAAGADRAQ